MLRIHLDHRPCAADHHRSSPKADERHVKHGVGIVLVSDEYTRRRRREACLRPAVELNRLPDTLDRELSKNRDVTRGRDDPRARQRPHSFRPIARRNRRLGDSRRSRRDRVSRRVPIHRRELQRPGITVSHACPGRNFHRLRCPRARHIHPVVRVISAHTRRTRSQRHRLCSWRGKVCRRSRGKLKICRKLRRLIHRPRARSRLRLIRIRCRLVRDHLSVRGRLRRHRGSSD